MIIIIVCIILMLLTWGFYFKSIREGNDPHAANYTMPISFSGEKDSKNERVKVPQFIETNNGESLNFVNDTNAGGHTNLKDTDIRGPVRIPINTPIEFGAGENKEINAGKITYGTWHDKGLCIVGGGGAPGQGPRQVHVWDDLTVDNNLYVNNGDITVQNAHWLQMKGGGINTEGINTNWQNVNWLNVNWGDINIKNGHGMNTEWLNTNGVNIKNKQYIGGMQFGWCDGNMPYREHGKSRNGLNVNENAYGWCSFNTPFDTDSVYIITNRNGGDSYDTLWSHGCSRIGQTNVWGQNRNGFYFRSSYVNDKGWFNCYFSRGDFPFFWFAISG